MQRTLFFCVSAPALKPIISLVDLLGFTAGLQTSIFKPYPTLENRRRRKGINRKVKPARERRLDAAVTVDDGSWLDRRPFAQSSYIAKTATSKHRATIL